ncbi:MAG: hypothetical protein PHN19_03575 [Patescibacteria group bacterium]|nr:hypothetical protein [Patescibacteria group bacterium]
MDKLFSPIFQHNDKEEAEMADEKDVDKKEDKTPVGILNEEFLAAIRNDYAAWDRLTPERQQQIMDGLCRISYNGGIDEPIIFDRYEEPERPSEIPEPLK